MVINLSGGIDIRPLLYVSVASVSAIPHAQFRIPDKTLQVFSTHVHCVLSYPKTQSVLSPSDVSGDHLNGYVSNYARNSALRQQWWQDSESVQPEFLSEAYFMCTYNFSFFSSSRQDPE